MRYLNYRHSNKQNTLSECNIGIKIEFFKPNIENAASARTFGCFWSKYLLYKKGV